MYDEYAIYNTAMAITGCRDDQLNRDYLEHHGIFGMKWGVRRYQNEDGSLTPEGERRYRETGYGERLGLTKMDQDIKSSAYGIGNIATPVAGVISKKKYYDKLKNMSDEEAASYEGELKNKARTGAKVSRGIFGSIMGSSGGMAIGTMAGLALGSPELAVAVTIGGAITGGMLGGVGGYKIAGKQFDKNWDKDMERNRYIKRTKKERDAYDREHAASNWEEAYKNAGGSLLTDNNANYEYDENGRVKSAKVRL